MFREAACILVMSTALAAPTPAQTPAPTPAPAPAPGLVHRRAHHREIPLHQQRSAQTDLEVTGLIRGLAPGTSAFLRREELLALPQIRATITDNPDLRGRLHVSGVSFKTLAAAIHVLPAADLIDALCMDRYRSHFPAGYIADHRPILVLTLDGKDLDSWAREHHQFNPGPYLVLYQHFVPAFKVLAHEDQPQLPDQLVRLNFTTESSTFDPIAPHGRFAADSPEQRGFIIARQNCLRCHFQGLAGGTKSGRDWHSIATWANEQPAYFEAYVRNPQRFESHSHMAPNPGYDAATLAALTAYFKTFAGATP